MMNATLQLLNHYRAIDAAAAEFAAAEPNTTSWLRARDRLQSARRLIHVHEAELAPVGTLYYRGNRA